MTKVSICNMLFTTAAPPVRKDPCTGRAPVRASRQAPTDRGIAGELQWPKLQRNAVAVPWAHMCIRGVAHLLQ